MFNKKRKTNKIAIISDIHGNYPALIAVLKDIEKEDVNEIICLGDLVGYYSMVNEVIETIRNLNIYTILGNHDRAMILNQGIIPRSKTCTITLTSQLTYITKENFDFLCSLNQYYVFKLFDKKYFCVHGGLKDYLDEYIGKLDKSYFERNNFEYDFLITGHTHIPKIEHFGKYTYLNPGSVGQPRDGNNKASYILLAKEKTEIKRINYDIEAIIERMKQAGFEEYISEVLYTGVKLENNDNHSAFIYDPI